MVRTWDEVLKQPAHAAARQHDFEVAQSGDFELGPALLEVPVGEMGHLQCLFNALTDSVNEQALVHDVCAARTGGAEGDVAGTGSRRRKTVRRERWRPHFRGPQ